MSQDNYEWMTLAEIYDTLPAVKQMCETYPGAFNVTPVARCKRYPDGDIGLKIEFLGHHEHVEHIVASYQINTSKDNIPPPEGGYTWAETVQLETIDDNINRAIAEAITRVPMDKLVPGAWLTHPETGINAQFWEWSLVDELEICVMPQGSKRPVCWNLEDILIPAS